MTKYFVVTPPYEEPGSCGSDVVEVEADTKREALVKGVRELRRTHSHWLQDQESDGHSPFAGLKVELVEVEVVKP